MRFNGPHLSAKNFAAVVERRSGECIKSKVHPTSQLANVSKSKPADEITAAADKRTQLSPSQ